MLHNPHRNALDNQNFRLIAFFWTFLLTMFLLSLWS